MDLASDSEVPERDPRNGYEDMQAFIATVESPELREGLDDGLHILMS
jgi:hypothetical protein